MSIKLSLQSFMFLLSFLLVGLTVRVVDAQCTNGACDYVVQLAATCQDTPSQTQNGTDCLCTERFRVNMDRCLRGIICAWDGTETTTLQACPAIYCPGSIPQSLLEECSISTSGITNWNTAAPSTISPTPRPLTYTDSTTTSGTNPTASGSGTVAASTTASSPNAGDGFTLGLSASAMLMFTFGISVILY